MENEEEGDFAIGSEERPCGRHASENVTAHRHGERALDRFLLLFCFVLQELKRE
jgi:hypothetical protein